MPSRIRDLLNKIRWDESNILSPSKIEITYIHRGAPRDEKTVLFSDVKDVLSAFFTIESELFPDEKTNIPFHRILKIRNIKTSEILYQKK